MLLTRKILREYLEGHFLAIPKKLEKELLDTYGKPVVDDEGHLREFTEQDVFEQDRKRINEYSRSA